jgi:hypothetical protein
MEIDAILRHYDLPLRTALEEGPVGLSPRATLDRLIPVMSNLAADLFAREEPVVAQMSKTKARSHLNQAEEAVLQLILPTVIAGQESGRHGIFENLPLGEAWGLLRFPSFRRRLRRALLERMRDENARMIMECAGDSGA